MRVLRYYRVGLQSKGAGNPAPWVGVSSVAWVIGILGVGIVVGFAAYLNANRSYLEVPILFLTVGIALVIVLSVGLLFAAYWVASQRFSRETEWHVVIWTLAGVIGTVALTFWPILYQRAVGNVVSDPTLLLLVSAGIGANAGALIGAYDARSRRQFEQVERARDTLLFLNRTLRHNVLNAVNLIDGYASLLESREDLPADDELHSHLATIRAQTASIADLISNARVLSRLDNDGLRPVDLSALLDDQLDALSKTYQNADIEGVYPPEVTVLADELLSAVIENLVSNAVLHNDNDQPTVRITVARDGGTVVLRVADDGPGIDEEVLVSAFDPGDHGDHGLGLYIVETLTDRYGGKVSVEDAEMGGAAVSVALQPG